MVGAKFDKLVEIMARLRGPDGCPWDREQNLKSLEPMLIEEVYEVIDAVEKEDYEGLAEELGDLLLHVVFHAQLAREMKEFAIEDVVDGICDKLIRRHPHVFGDGKARGSDEVVETWEAIKAEEKLTRKLGRSVLEGIPTKLPALHEAHKISSRVARVGFDWPEIDGVFDKLYEEIDELQEAMALPPGNRAREALEDEIGDAFFVMVNIARFLKIDSESALKRANQKFRARFEFIERELEDEGKSLEESSLPEMEAIWQRAKELH